MIFYSHPFQVRRHRVPAWVEIIRSLQLPRVPSAGQGFTQEAMLLFVFHALPDHFPLFPVLLAVTCARLAAIVRSRLPLNLFVPLVPIRSTPPATVHCVLLVTPVQR